MDYSQFGKMLTKLEEMEHLMKGLDHRLEQIANNMIKSCEEVNTTLLRIEQIIDAYMAHSLKAEQNDQAQ